MSMSFQELGLSPVVCAPLARLGYGKPTPVQAEAIPVVLSGVDLLARAQTGTGKTAAFGLPMIERLLAGPGVKRRFSPRGLVLVPTRELAVQVYRSLSAYGAPSRIRVTAIFGGAGMGGQIQELRRGTDIVVATPGRLIDHLERRTIELSGIEILTLDEADRMLDMGFLPAIKRVIAALPQVRQTLLFSATLAPAIVRLAADFTREPARVDISGGDTVAATVTHQIHPVQADDKRTALTHVLTQHGDQQALVFCRTRRGADRVGEHLERQGVRIGVIHANKTQGARLRALDQFKGSRLQVLVATDIAARGLDIPQLPLVVNYDLPLVAEDYVHRVGRTGRAGHSGRAVSLVSPPESSLLRGIQRLLPSPLEEVAIPGLECTLTTHAGNQPPVRKPGHAASRQAPRRPFHARQSHGQKLRSADAPFRRRSSGHAAPRAATRG
jgi:ATP-dependent RNA helicase RhlE